MIISSQELHLRETRLREELQSQEAEISRLREELRMCWGLLWEEAQVSRGSGLAVNCMSVMLLYNLCII